MKKFLVEVDDTVCSRMTIDPEWIHIALSTEAIVDIGDYTNDVPTDLEIESAFSVTCLD